MGLIIGQFTWTEFLSIFLCLRRSQTPRGAAEASFQEMQFYISIVRKELEENRRPQHH